MEIITLLPGARVSLQRHQHRSETWQVLDLAMDVEIDGVVTTAGPGSRVHIPVGAAHRIGDSGTGRARFLEVCFGTFDEDDVERLAGDHDRWSPAGRALRGSRFTARGVRTSLVVSPLVEALARVSTGLVQRPFPSRVACSEVATSR